MTQYLAESRLSPLLARFAAASIEQLVETAVSDNPSEETGAFIKLELNQAKAILLFLVPDLL